MIECRNIRLQERQRYCNYAQRRDIAKGDYKTGGYRTLQNKMTIVHDDKCGNTDITTIPTRTINGPQDHRRKKPRRVRVFELAGFPLNASVAEAESR